MNVAKLPLVVSIAAVALAGCAKTPITTSLSAPPPAAAAPARSTSRGAAPVAKAAAARAGASRPSEFTPVEALRDIHFAFDRYEILPEDAKVLDMDAAWLRDNARTLVLVEGHADERGTNEYNLVLGERRAKATLDYLVSRGVQSARLTLISYGEERPLCAARTEACWAQNRRAHFLVKPE